MSKPVKLDDARVQEELKKRSDWFISAGRLHREFKFKNFVQAFSWMAAVALEAEKLDHHPEWFNSYNSVRVDLVTHSIAGLSENDFVLAEKMDQHYRQYQGMMIR